MRALLTQVVVADNELKDYTPKYGNPAINSLRSDDMGVGQSQDGGAVSRTGDPALQIWNLHFYIEGGEA